MRVKVTGYLDIDRSDSEGDPAGPLDDMEHPTGLSEHGHEYYTAAFDDIGLNELKFERVL